MAAPDPRGRIFDRLDEQQAAAVRHLHGPAIVVAGAGSGKTTVLTRRIGNLIQAGVKPAAILLTTFTRNSARDMVERARSVCPEAVGITAGNFHSIAARLIKDNHASFGLPPNFGMLDPGDVEVVMRQVVADDRTRHPKEDQGPQAKTLAKIVSYAVNTQSSVADVVIGHHPKHHPVLDRIEAMAAAYVAYKKERFLLDFDDMLTCFAMFAEHPVSGRYVRERWSHVMIDEHQDSNALQFRIINGLAGDCTGERSVMAVGDPSQSIYTFRGAVPSGMMAFQKRWAATRTYLIETNYRSTPEIVRCADEVDRSQVTRFSRKLASGRPSVSLRPALVTLPDREAEADRVAEMILERRERGIPLSAQAVLVRSMRNGRHVEVALARREIPYRVVGGIKIHEAAQIRDLLAVMRVMINPLDEPAWMRFLAMFPKVGEKTASGTARRIGRDATFEEAVAALARDAIVKPVFAPAVRVLQSVMGLRSPHAVLMTALSALEELFLATYPDDWDQRRKDVVAVADLAVAFDDVEEFVRTITVDVALDRDTKGAAGGPDGDGVLTLSSVHGSKGLEWDTVYIPSFVEGHFPSMQATRTGELEEEKRLLYVAVTRAKRELVILKPQRVMSKGYETMSTSSGFEAMIRPHLDHQAPRPPGQARPRLDGNVLISFR